jgi:beta-lactamase regulating signal transducer with metallopeptidase domain
VAWILTWLVQSVALCAATAGLVRLPGFRARASARAAAWSVALLGTAVLASVPWLTWPAAEAAGLIVADAATGSANVRRPFELPIISGVWLAAGLAIWVMGAAVWMGWASREVARVVRLKRASEPWTADERRRLAPWVEARLRARGARLGWCDDLDGPALLGFRHPVIALPRLHGARLTDEELQQVLLHEAAHLRRRDDWASLVELAVAGLLWINPVVHVARRGLGLAREMACDDWVVRQTSAPVAYARCLTAVADLRRASHRSSLAAAATSTRSALARRVTRVLDADRRPGARASHLLALMTPVAVGALAIVLIQTPPLVVDGRVAAVARPAAALADRGAPPMSATAVERAARTTLALPRPTGVVRPSPVAAVQTPVAAVRTPVAAGQTLPVGSAASAAESSPVPVWPREPGAMVDASQAAPPLGASPLPGAGMLGVSAADGSVAAPIEPSESAPWWGRTARVGSATSERATAAGQTTASFIKRLGSSVARSLNR